MTRLPATFRASSRRLRDMFTGWTIVCFLLWGACAFTQTTKTWNQSSGTNDWFVSANWDPAGAPEAGDHVVITNDGIGIWLTNSTPMLASLVLSNNVTMIFSNWPTALNADSVSIGSNAAITCVGGFINAAMSNRVNIVTDDLLIQHGGRIDVDARGYAGGDRISYDDGQGPGGGIYGGNNHGGGGSYGGEGGNGGGAAPGTVYGDPEAPLLPGSGGGGGQNSSQPGGNGGGAVRIYAPNGTVNIHGIITARGGATAQYGPAGGSGGGVYIVCRTLGGTNGIIDAGGGHHYPPTHGNYGGGGGGGRIAVIAVENTWENLRMGCGGGHAMKAYGSMPGFMGSVYVSNPGSLPLVWSVGGARLLYTNSPCRIDSLTISNRHIELSDMPPLVVEGDAVLVASNVWNRSWAHGLFVTNQTVFCRGSMRLDGFNMSLHATTNEGCATSNRFELHVDRDLILTNSASIETYSGGTNDNYRFYDSLVSVTGTVTIASNCWIYPYSEIKTPSDFTHSLGGTTLFRMGNLIVHSNAGFNADTLGYNCYLNQSGAYPGAGPGGGIHEKYRRELEILRRNLWRYSGGVVG